MKGGVMLDNNECYSCKAGKHNACLARIPAVGVVCSCVECSHVEITPKPPEFSIPEIVKRLVGYEGLFDAMVDINDLDADTIAFLDLLTLGLPESNGGLFVKAAYCLGVYNAARGKHKKALEQLDKELST